MIEVASPNINKKEQFNWFNEKPPKIKAKYTRKNFIKTMKSERAIGSG